MTRADRGEHRDNGVIDVGQTAIRVRLWSDDKEPIERTGPPACPLVSKANADAICSTLAEAVRDGGIMQVESITIGLSGFFDDRELTSRMAANLGDLLSTRRVVVADDVLTGFLGALPGTDGAVITAGTGAVALAVAPDGLWSKCDGHGGLLGDHGSGYAIGREGLRAAIRTIDEVDSNSEKLAAALLEQYGSTSELRRSVQATHSPQAVLAGFAPVVAALARTGDKASVSIWASAARSLAQTTATALSRVGHVDHPTVSYVGGLFEAADLLLEPFRTELTRRVPGVEITVPRGGALAGALRLHRDGAPDRLGALVHTDDRGDSQ